MEVPARVPTYRRRPVTICLNGAEYLALAKWSRDACMTIPAYIRTRCGLPAWGARGSEMAGRTSATTRNRVMAMDRIMVTFPLSIEEYAALGKRRAEAFCNTMPQVARTLCGFRVRYASQPGTDAREDEMDDAWDLLRRLGLNPAEYFKPETL
jgi:hypothetical protein